MQNRITVYSIKEVEVKSGVYSSKISKAWNLFLNIFGRSAI